MSHEGNKDGVIFDMVVLVQKSERLGKRLGWLVVLKCR